MTIQKFAAKLLSALTLCCFAHGASATVINYSVTVDNFVAAYGQFTGFDSNADGILSKNELTAFSYEIPGGYDFSLAQVSDFGSYNIAKNIWNHDASGWGLRNFAYVSFEHGLLSVNLLDTTDVVTTVARTSVPEPSSIALVALGLAAAWLARRRAK
ncbi:PEP-CTERM sorting domain-containing protein [Rugamonas sp.]|uniref:PEP-CTERM sorting domain-containing protein n=1 Tax=Rugamonas sp. TaxID=1926287 RepID=UPI0025FC520C|nr:PEP-CTERM sorting domain-containing protein [Rugamonas sp.]